MESMDTIPPEIWEKILNCLDDFDDCKNASKACLKFENILSNSKSSWLFGETLFWFVRYLSAKDLLSCRLVCKRWNFSVDYILEDYVSNQLPNESPLNVKRKLPILPRSFHCPVYTLYVRHPFFHGYYTEPQQTLDNLQVAINTQKPHRYPFPGQYAMILGEMIQSPTVLHFLQKFGHHLKHLKLCCDKFPVESRLALLAQILDCTKNLKQLDLHWSSSCKNNVFNSEVSGWNEGISKSGKCLLPKLKSINLAVNGNGLSPDVELVLVSLLFNKNLESVRLRGMNIPSFAFINLTEINIKVKHDSSLENMIRLKAPLKRIYLIIADPNVRTNLVTDVLCNFDKTLKYIGLEFNAKSIKTQYYSDQPIPLSDLNPAKLQKLENVDSASLNGIYSLNFLCGLNSTLKYLHIDINTNSPYFRDGNFCASVETIDLLYLVRLKPPRYKWELKTLYKSNVWKELPKLKHLSVRIIDRYDRFQKELTRDVYENINLHPAK